jgi:CspA family cold shock protein
MRPVPIPDPDDDGIAALLDEIVFKIRPCKSQNPVQQRPQILPDGGGADVYVHASVVEKAGLKELHFGIKVTFDLVLNHHGKPVADNLRVQ